MYTDIYDVRQFAVLAFRLLLERAIVADEFSYNTMSTFVRMLSNNLRSKFSVSGM